MNKQHFILGIAGRANSGKDTAANLILKYILHYCRHIPASNIFVYSASEFIRSDLAKMTGGSVEVIDTNKRKDPALRWILEQYGINYLGEAEITKRMNSGILDLIETHNPTVIMIPSLRSINQADAVHSLSGVILRIRRRCEDQDREPYASETQLERIRHDLFLDNDWSLLRFEHLVLDIFKDQIQPLIENKIPCKSPSSISQITQ